MDSWMEHKEDGKIVVHLNPDYILTDPEEDDYESDKVVFYRPHPQMLHKNNRIYEE